jgi:hypothetical protein
MRLSTRRLAALLVCTLLLAVPAADAKDPQAVTGTYTLQPYALYSMVQHSKNVCILEFGIYFRLAGDLNGTVDLTVTMNLKGTCGDGSAPANLHGKGSFVGALGESGGTFEGTFVAWHEQGQAHGRIVIQHGAGDLAGLHGILNVAGTPGVGGVYSGELHFAP